MKRETQLRKRNVNVLQRKSGKQLIAREYKNIYEGHFLNYSNDNLWNKFIILQYIIYIDFTLAPNQRIYRNNLFILSDFSISYELLDLDKEGSV